MRAIEETVRTLQRFAYRIICEIRYMYRPKLAWYRGLKKIVWSPEPDFLRLLQAYFKNEEAEYKDAEG